MNRAATKKNSDRPNTYQALICPIHRLLDISMVWSGVDGVSIDRKRRLSLGTFAIYSEYPTVFFPFSTSLRRCAILCACSGLVGSSFVVSISDEEVDDDEAPAAFE